MTSGSGAARTKPARAGGSARAAKTVTGKSSGLRATRGVQRRQAILDAALEEFADNGFAATRLDDVARRAGIAKGTIYLYFRDKETLFRDLIRAMFAPVVQAIEAFPREGQPVRATFERLIDFFLREVLATRRKDVIRLVIAEGSRFPKLAEIHHREVVERVMAAMSELMARGVKSGEVRSDAYARFPQLFVAPALVAVIWSGLFNRFAPLDAGAMLRAHLDIVFGKRPVS